MIVPVMIEVTVVKTLELLTALVSVVLVQISCLASELFQWYMYRGVARISCELFQWYMLHRGVARISGKRGL